MMYFKVQKGYGEKDYVEIDETELEKAIKAQVSGQVAFFSKGGTVSGNHIISITPDFDKVEKAYNPSGPDYLPDHTRNSHFLAIENAGEVVKAKIENRVPQLKGPEHPIPIKKIGSGSIGEFIER